MSKVKIQPNASGTGIFTVAAPATNTDRTITLPDVDATVLTTAGGTINGVTQISNPIETGYASNLAETVSKATLLIKTHSTNSTLTTFGGISGGDAYIQRSNGPGTTEYNLRLNPYGGAVLMPGQPSFNATGGGSNVSGAITFSTIYVNIGSCYNASTGRFTAPFAGRYFFFTQFLMNSGASDIRFDVNGGAQAFYGESNETTYKQMSLAGVLNLNANDYVQVNVWSGSAYGGQYCNFTGHLIG